MLLMKVANLPKKKIQLDFNNTSVKECSIGKKTSLPRRIFLHFNDDKKLICILTISIELGISEPIGFFPPVF